MAARMAVSVQPVGTEKPKSCLDLSYEGIAGTGAVGPGEIVCVGDAIDVGGFEGTYLRGHGTRVDTTNSSKGVLRATVCGTVERVNKLITVRPIRSQYTAEVGDVVVGTVTEISGKRWKVGLRADEGTGSKGTEAVLHLSAINLPGGVQRRRTWEDELNMRNVFREQDCVCCEVQSIHADGTVALHARSAKYGKLTSGRLVSVPPFLVKRQKQNFLSIPFGPEDAEPTREGKDDVRVVLGYNGSVWVCSSSGVIYNPESRFHDEDDEDDAEGGDGEAGSSGKTEEGGVSGGGKRKRKGSASANGAGAHLLYSISLVSNVVRALGLLSLPLTGQAIRQGVRMARELKVEPNLMCKEDFMEKLVDQEATRRVIMEDET